MSYYKFDNFEEYLIQGEPSQSEKAKIWQVAVGLQKIDTYTFPIMIILP